ncbi:MAG: insulinase family protein [Acidobacteriota bacterium]|nr:insulinase family protein [Acidobacteriota bacterium]
MLAQQKAPAKAAAGAIPKVEFERYTLPNGLDVILHVDRKLPIVHVNQWYHVGSKNERAGRTGFAHLFEHEMFQGSKNVPGEYFDAVEKAGANLQEGGVNGTTSNDRTNYFATVPSGSLEYLLWVEADRLATLPEAMSQEKLDEQRAVVRNERRQGLENTPYGRWFTLILENLHPAGHPYSWSVIGSHEDLVAASLEDVREFFRRYYTPNNLTLTIAGDFDPAEAKKLVEKYFGGLQAGPALDRPDRYMPVLDGEKIVEVMDRVPQERTYFAWPTPAYFEKGDADLDLASLILTDGLSARLNKNLVYDKQLASNVTSFNNGMEISGFFAIWATARPGASLDDIEKIVTDEIARLAKNGPTAEEVDRAKTKWEYNFVTGLERIGGFGGKADLLGQYNTFLGDPARFDEDVQRYRGATAASIKDAVSKHLDTRNRLLVRFHPEVSARAAADTLDRSKAPAIAADRRFVTPEVKSAKLDNGMNVYVVERHDLPKVAVSFATKAGTITDPSGKEGIAHLGLTTIDMGTKTRKALEIEDALGDLGTELGGLATREYAALNFEVLERNLPSALNIVADVIRNPQYPADEVDREKKRHLDALGQQNNNPNAVAGRVRAMLAFGADHPYGRPAQGLPSTVAKIERADLASYHQTYWKPGTSTVIFVGDVSMDKALKLAGDAFGSWPAGSAPAVSVPAPRPAQPGRVYLVDRQDAAQTVVSQILPGPKRTVDDYYAFRLVDAVWGGGGFGTRLNLNLRENKGYSYGVFSNMANYNDFGMWWSAGGVQTDKTKESVVEFVSEMDNLAGKKPISQAELTTAQQGRVRGYSQQFESLSRISGQIATLWAQGLPMTELQREVDATGTATMADVTAASKKYVTPNKLSLLLVGDLAKIEPGIRSLNLGEVVVLDVEGKPVTK